MRFIPYVHHAIEVELPVSTVIESLSKEVQRNPAETLIRNPT